MIQTTCSYIQLLTTRTELQEQKGRAADIQKIREAFHGECFLLKCTLYKFLCHEENYHLFSLESSVEARRKDDVSTATDNTTDWSKEEKKM